MFLYKFVLIKNTCFLVKKELILIADDNDVVLTFTALAVEKMGYETVIAKNGIEAFEKAIINNPDLIIVDWKMPEMDGLEATRLLRENPVCKHTPIIMITGTDKSSDLMTRAMDNGVNDFLRKPFDRVELKARMKSLLKQANFVKQIIEIKNNELNHKAIQLANYVDFQKSVNSKLELLIEKVENIEAKDIISKLIDKIKINEKLNPLDTLRQQFIEINNNFTSNLLSKHPNITPAELKLCMLLRLNLNTKEIAVLVFQTYDSVRVSRTRLREKLQLDASENLPNYLMQF